MPTKSRKESGTGMYHVVARGINKEQILKQAKEKRQLMKIIKEYAEKYEVEIYSYCLMSNHFHLMFYTDFNNLSIFMARVLAEYAEYYNYKHQRNGHVFQNRFKSECIEDLAYFWNCIRYIHLNPVKAGMVRDVLGYRFSSMNEYRTGKENLVHEKAMRVYQKHFINLNQFVAFHGKMHQQVFLDTADDILMQQQEIAFQLANQIQISKKLEDIAEVIEDKDSREEYKEMIKDTLQVSKSKTNQLYKFVKDSIMNNC